MGKLSQLGSGNWADRVETHKEVASVTATASHDIKTTLEWGQFSIEQLAELFHKTLGDFKRTLIEKYHDNYEQLAEKRVNDPVRGKVLIDLHLPSEEEILDNMMLPLEKRMEQAIRLLVNRPEERVQKLIVSDEQKIALLTCIKDIHDHNVSDWVCVPYKLENGEAKYAMQEFDTKLDLDDTQHSRYLFEMLADAGLLGTPHELEELRGKIDELNGKIKKFWFLERINLSSAVLSPIRILHYSSENSFPIWGYPIWAYYISLTIAVLYLTLSKSWAVNRIKRSRLKSGYKKLEHRDAVINALDSFNYQWDIQLPYELRDNLPTERLEELLADNKARIKNYKQPQDRAKFKEMLKVMNPSIDEKQFATLRTKIAKEAEQKKSMPIPRDLLPDSLNTGEIKNINKETLLQLGLDKNQAENFATELELMKKNEPADDTLDLTKFNWEAYKEQVKVKEELRKNSG